MKSIDKIITEEINKFLLKETYNGVLYHYTTLPLLYSILRQNNLIADSQNDTCHYQYRRGMINPKDGHPYDSLCFTRDKNYNIRNGYGVDCRLVFDANRLMQIRNAKLYPVNFSKLPKFNNSNEAEERLYGINIHPLSKYISHIDVIISDLSKFGDGCTDIEDRLYEKYADWFQQKHPEATDSQYWEFLGQTLINRILKFKNFRGKINIIYKNKQ